MRKTVLFGLIALILVLGGATGMLYGKYRKSQSDYSAMQASEETTRNRYGSRNVITCIVLSRVRG